MSYEAAVHAKAIELTRLALEMTAAAGAGHPTSAASLAHVVTILMYDHMRYDPKHPADPLADRLVLSEGHACPIVYAAAADLGLPIVVEGKERRMTRDDAMTLRAIDSPIEGHPNPVEGFPFFPAATGSLGQGLSVSAGIALAARLDGVPKRVFCLIGDGESREGQNWEALDFLVEHRIAGVCPIFNCNHQGQTGAVSEQQSPEKLAAKLEACGFRVELVEGHDPSALRRALDLHARASEAEGLPVAIVMKTVKAWGTPSVPHELHGKPISGDDLEQALAELEETGRKLGARWTEGELSIPTVTARRKHGQERTPTALPGFREALERTDRSDLLETGKLATRKAYGVALQMLGHARPEIVALDGDVSNSTYTEYFAKDEALSGRFFECRIAEQNMMSVAAGLASGGKKPFLSSFGKFVSRGYDQLEMALLGGFDLKIVGSHVGASVASDGPSQMALTDVAYFRSLSTLHRPDGLRLMVVLTPADAYAAYALTLAMADLDAPCYLRTLRPDVPFLYDERTRFEPGGHQVLREGDRLLVVASGYMVHEAKKACDELASQGVETTLVDAYSIPFDAEALCALASRNGGRVLTVEDVYGGSLGSAVADALLTHGEAFRLEQMHVRRPPKSGRKPEELLDLLGLSTGHIVRTASTML